MRVSEERGKALQGVEYYRDPFNPTLKTQLPAGYKNVFKNSKDEFILTDDNLFDPAVTFQQDWRRAEIVTHRR